MARGPEVYRWSGAWEVGGMWRCEVSRMGLANAWSVMSGGSGLGGKEGSKVNQVGWDLGVVRWVVRWAGRGSLRRVRCVWAWEHEVG